MTITVDTIMATQPCDLYPREYVERILAEVGPIDSWEALAIAARDRGWRDVSLGDLRLTAYRAATPEQRRRGVVHSTRARVEAQARRWPEVDGAVAGVRRQLLAWEGDFDEICRIRDASYAADATSYAAAYSVAGAYAAAWDGLMYVCRLLDGTETR